MIGDVLGTPTVFQVGDRDITLSPITQGVKGRFEAAMAADARREVLSFVNEVTPDVLAKMLADFAAQKAAYAFAWGGARWQQTVSSGPGLGRLFYELTRESHPTMLQDEAAKLVEDYTADVSRAVAEVIKAGNPKAPQAGGK